MILRCKKICYVICVILFTSSIRASVLKEVLEDHLKDIVHNEGVESVKHDKQKGEKNHHIESQINDNHSDQRSKVIDDAKYLKQEHDTKKSSENDAYAGYNSKQDKAQDKEASGFKREHKKGHHKQGFQNSYHKDESSNKSTYFDDFNDEGDQSAYNVRSNSHDDQLGRSYKGGHENGQEYVRDNFNNRGHNRYGDIGKKQIGHQDYARKHYLDDYENYNKHHNDHGSHSRDNVRNRHEYNVPQNHHDHGTDWQRWENRNHWERPDWDRRLDVGEGYGGPGYYDNHGRHHVGGYGYGPNQRYGFDESQETSVDHLSAPPPVLTQRKQTITIYEDPRYDGTHKGQFRREDGDYVHLDFQPSRQRYASYDDVYYNTPQGHGAMEASRINRLVYNYRRQ